MGRSRKVDRRALNLTDQTSTAAIQDLTRRWGLGPWDLLLIGDGSGGDAHRPCGWSVVVVDRGDHTRRVLYGALSHGSSYCAELLPILHALQDHADRQARRGRGGTRRYRVAALTDNMALASQVGALRDGRVRLDQIRTHRPLWACLQGLIAQGYDLDVHWMPRASLALHVYSDWIAGEARRALARVSRPVDAAGRPVPAEACNPDPGTTPARARRRRGRRGRGGR